MSFIILFLVEKKILDKHLCQIDIWFSSYTSHTLCHLIIILHYYHYSYEICAWKLSQKYIYVVLYTNILFTCMKHYYPLSEEFILSLLP